MPDYIVSGEQLTAIANAIREKTGNTGSLTFPGGFTEGISGIETVRSIDTLIDRSITEISSDVSSIGDYVFSKCENLLSANFPTAVTVGLRAFEECENLQTVNLPIATTIGTHAFTQCIRLQSLNAPNVSSLGASSLKNCNTLKTVTFPLADKIPSNAFSQSTSLTTADFTDATSIETYAFTYCSKFTSLILRGEIVVTLDNINVFTGTKIESGTGYIYVPAALVDTYKAATNWSTYANQFRALEDYTVDGTTTGELDSTKI